MQGSAVVGADALPFQQYGMQPGFPVKGIEFGQKLVEAFVGLFYLCSPGSPFQIEDAWRAQFGRQTAYAVKVSASRACEFAMRYTVSVVRRDRPEELSVCRSAPQAGAYQ